jgi:hypothetical protein
MGIIVVSLFVLLPPNFSRETFGAKGQKILTAGFSSCETKMDLPFVIVVV